MYGGIKAELQAFEALALDGAKWSGNFTIGEESTVPLKRCFVDPRASLDIQKKGSVKFFVKSTNIGMS